MTRAELFSSMTSAEMTDWQALWIIRNEEKEEAAKRAALEKRR